MTGSAETVRVKTTLVVYAWDGKSQPLEWVTKDTDHRLDSFSLLLFDYSGDALAPDGVDCVDAFLSCRTECKGEIYREVHRWLTSHREAYDYVGLIDDDIALACSDLNRLLAVAREYRLDSFAPALNAESYHAHKRFLAQSGSTLRYVDWVEVMMPFYRTALFLAGGRYYELSISSYGLDQFVLPTLQKLTGMDRVAIVDTVVVSHLRPITSDGKVFSNGLTAHQERAIQRRMAMAQVSLERPDLIGSAWHCHTFAPWNGPGRFWPLRLCAPWLWLRQRWLRGA